MYLLHYYIQYESNCIYIICVFSLENKVAPSIKLNLIVLFPTYFINKFIENNRLTCVGTSVYQNRRLGHRKLVCDISSKIKVLLLSNSMVTVTYQIEHFYVKIFNAIFNRKYILKSHHFLTHGKGQISLKLSESLWFSDNFWGNGS